MIKRAYEVCMYQTNERRWIGRRKYLTLSTGSKASPFEVISTVPFIAGGYTWTYTGTYSHGTPRLLQLLQDGFSPSHLSLRPSLHYRVRKLWVCGELSNWPRQKRQAIGVLRGVRGISSSESELSWACPLVDYWDFSIVDTLWHGLVGCVPELKRTC